MEQSQPIDMPSVAEQYGYKFSHKGCPCNGLPHYYKKQAADGGNMELALFPKRGIYRLYKNNSKVAFGTDNTLTNSLQSWE